MRSMCCHAVAAASMLACAGSSLGQTELFLAEYQFNAARIAAMNLDGTAPRTLFDLPADLWLPLGISYDAKAGRLYWMDSAGPSEVYAANTDGSDRALVANVPGFARGVGRDAQGRIYYSSDNTVQRVNPDGSGLLTIFTSQTSDPVGTCEVDATNGHVYVGAMNSILRMDLDGNNVKTVVVGISQPRAIALDVATSHIYWLDADTISDYVGRARLDGTDFRVLIDHTPNEISGSTSLVDILFDPVSRSLYFADDILATVERADADGGDVQVIYTSPAGKAPAGFTLSTGDPVQPLLDCNANGIADDLDIAAGAPDCDNNGVIDTCQADPCPERVFLLDQGSDAANASGRALGVPSQWQVFQPFDVPAGGWDVAEWGIDGHTNNYADGSGITWRLFRDNGTGDRPDESAELGSGTFNLRFGTNFENWVYVPAGVSLDEGRYWLRLEANNPTVYAAAVNHGFTGLLSLSRGSSGNFSNPASPIALRVVQREDAACAADFNDDGNLNSQDFFDFLAAFFKNDPGADFNADGSVNSQDFFDFVSAFFAGC